MSKPKVILFAGPIGSSKTPIAYHLSYNLDLPMFNLDTIRTEVKEDLGTFDIEEFEKRSRERLEKIIDRKISFILDASIDRKWGRYKNKLKDYNTFIISIDISKELLKKLYKYKGYDMKSERIDKNYEEHLAFLDEYSESVDIHITDKDFNSRLEATLKAAKGWYNN